MVKNEFPKQIADGKNGDFLEVRLCVLDANPLAFQGQRLWSDNSIELVLTQC